MRPFLALLALLAACDDQDVDLDDTSTPGYTVDVVADGQTVPVDLSTLGTVAFEGNQVVPLPGVLAASGLNTTWSERTYDFVASDGYRPSTNDCPPVDWDAMQMGYIYPASGNVVWDKAAGLPGCYNVDETVTIDVQDLTAAGYTVDVVADVGTASVDLSTLTAVDFEGSPAVTLPDVLAASGLSVTWVERTYMFEASDGYRPSDSGCDPVDWKAMQVGYLLQDNGNLVWDEAAKMRGCYYVDGTVIVDVQGAAR